MKPAPIIPMRSVLSGLRWAMVFPSPATDACRHYGASPPDATAHATQAVTLVRIAG